MAAQRRYDRFMGLAIAGGPLLAQADATSNLTDLHNAGIQDVNGGDAALLLVGQKLCTQLRYGVSPAQLKIMALQRSDAKLGANGLTPQQANEVVNYPIVDLCPEY